MRKSDKKKNMQRVNLLAENKYLESKGIIREGEMWNRDATHRDTTGDTNYEDNFDNNPEMDDDFNNGANVEIVGNKLFIDGEERDNWTIVKEPKPRAGIMMDPNAPDMYAGAEKFKTFNPTTGQEVVVAVFEPRGHEPENAGYEMEETSALGEERPPMPRPSNKYQYNTMVGTVLHDYFFKGKPNANDAQFLDGYLKALEMAAQQANVMINNLKNGQSNITGTPPPRAQVSQPE